MVKSIKDIIKDESEFLRNDQSEINYYYKGFESEIFINTKYNFNFKLIHDNRDFIFDLKITYDNTYYVSVTNNKIYRNYEKKYSREKLGIIKSLFKSLEAQDIIVCMFKYIRENLNDIIAKDEFLDKMYECQAEQENKMYR